MAHTADIHHSNDGTAVIPAGQSHVTRAGDAFPGSGADGGAAGERAGVGDGVGTNGDFLLGDVAGGTGTGGLGQNVRSLSRRAVSFLSVSGVVALGKIAEAVAFDTSLGAGTANLPALAVAPNGARYWVKNRVGGAFNVIIDGSGAETIDGAATLTLLPGQAVIILKSAGGWIVFACCDGGGSGELGGGAIVPYAPGTAIAGTSFLGFGATVGIEGDVNWTAPRAGFMRRLNVTITAVTGPGAATTALTVRVAPTCVAGVPQLFADTALAIAAVSGIGCFEDTELIAVPKGARVSLRVVRSAGTVRLTAGLEFVEMALTPYPFAIAETANGKINAGTITQQIQAAIATELRNVQVAYGAHTFTCWFENALTPAEETALNALVAAHVGDPLADYREVIFGRGALGTVVQPANDFAFDGVRDYDEYTLPAGITVKPSPNNILVIRARKKITIAGTLDADGVTTQSTELILYGSSTQSGGGGGGGGGDVGVVPGNSGQASSPGTSTAILYTPGAWGAAGAGGANGSPGAPGSTGGVGVPGVPQQFHLDLLKLSPAFGWGGIARGALRGISGTDGAQGGDGAVDVGGTAGAGGAGGAGGQGGDGGATVILLAPEIEIAATGIVRSRGTVGGPGVGGTAGGAGLVLAGGGGGGGGGAGGSGGCGGLVIMRYRSLSTLGAVDVSGGAGGSPGGAGGAGGAGAGIGAANGGAGAAGADGPPGSAGIFSSQQILT